MEHQVPFTGHLIFIGFGSITRATLPLLLGQDHVPVQHITVIAPVIEKHIWFKERGISFVPKALTEPTFVQVLDRFVRRGDFIVNLSVEVSSLALMAYAFNKGALYLDTCVEPWVGGYDDPQLSLSRRTNYALRYQVLALQKKLGRGPTAVVAHGANPGLITHLLKAGLVELAVQLNHPLPHNSEGVDWARLCRETGIKVIHFAERDTQRSKQIKQDDEFVNTWSVEGFISEGCQPAELGWGTHERSWPSSARRHRFGSRNAIYLERPSASIRVKTWTPLAGPCLGLMITHHETASTADLLTVKDQRQLIYRPTLYYAYRPCNDALLSMHELIGRGWQSQPRQRILNGEIDSGGIDALGVLLMGHELNAYWFGSVLSIDEARARLPFNNATSLQVAAGVLAGIVWAVEHPDRGIVEPEQMDYERVLEVARPYLGSLVGKRTDWQPSTALYETSRDQAAFDWQFEQFIRL
ncbi:homospermidine synthase [Pseudomonas sp. NFACC15-1]|uniref:saccharopine dehydrogenase C-terminal domain-containing protein n=1 Tax=unclassified Pseudomonas TaxID=196821 RepID=UPI000880B813|nr:MULTISPECIES: saccharopine dehydrogenase C-terminal domain-containing protein [unclassified Pseudomonas]SDA85281.1 homospermidine synthase [Pseudomonas sp. NFACC15-1]SDW68193.1 homospermidine synthase [Pseudomonas sp. NFACC14]